MKILIIFTAMSITPLGWADMPHPNLTITEADGGKTIAFRVGETITVRISNPAAGGYDIVTEFFDPKILKLQARKDVPPEPTPIHRYGDFGKIVFEFEAIGAGETDLVIRIARRWEVKIEPEEYFRVRIRVME
jgi:predicted secreted protein